MRVLWKLNLGCSNIILKSLSLYQNSEFMLRVHSIYYTLTVSIWKFYNQRLRRAYVGHGGLNSHVGWRMASWNNGHRRKWCVCVLENGVCARARAFTHTKINLTYTQHPNCHLSNKKLCLNEKVLCNGLNYSKAFHKMPCPGIDPKML